MSAVSLRMPALTSLTSAPATGSSLDATGRLAQYVLIPRIAAPGLTLVALNRDPQLVFVLSVVVPAMMILNYLALRHWDLVTLRLRIADKPYYLLLDVALALTVLAVVGVGTPMVLYLVAAGVLAGLVYRALPAVGASLVATAGYVVILLAHTGAVPGHWDFHTTVTLPSVVLTSGAAGVALRRLLNQQARQARQLATLREAAAVRDERLRMARDMHDSLTKNLHGVWLLSRSVDGALDRGDLAGVRAATEVIGTTARELSEEARKVIRGLRDENPRQSLTDALRDSAAKVTAGHPITVTVLDRRGPGALDPAPGSRHELIAIVAEALHNALKHARARTIEIELTDDVYLPGTLVTSVTDDGVGFVGETESLPARGHFGLLGMQERAERVGGSARVCSTPGAGTSVRVTLPVVDGPSPARPEGVREHAGG